MTGRPREIVLYGPAAAPFTEKVPTYTLRMDDDLVLVDPNPNPPGTFVEPLQVDERENRT